MQVQRHVELFWRLQDRVFPDSDLSALDRVVRRELPQGVIGGCDLEEVVEI